MVAVEALATAGKSGQEGAVFRDADGKAQQGRQLLKIGDTLAPGAGQLGYHGRTAGLQGAVPGDGAVSGQAADALPVG